MPARPTGPVRSPNPPAEDPPRWAASLAVSDSFLNGLARTAIGEGIEVGPLERTMNMPMMGAIELMVAMTITGVEFAVTARADGRIHATVSASGRIEPRGDSLFPGLPGPARVRGEVLVSPTVELRSDGSFAAALDLAGSELLAMHFDGIDGMETDADAQVMLGQMLFQTVGGDLFAGLAAHLGSIGVDLGADDAAILAEAGIAPGRADVVLGDGALVVGLRGAEGMDGYAELMEIDGPRFAVAVASGTLSAVAARLLRDAVGAPVPFEVEVDSRRRRVGGSVRNRRMVALPFVPDLRPGLRYTVRPRLEGDRVELTLREAWIELPLVPGFVNDVSRFIGGGASRVPLTVSLPASLAVPARPGGSALVALRVSHLEVGEHGVSLVVEAEL